MTVDPWQRWISGGGDGLGKHIQGGYEISVF